jgi:hypothetical protein
MAEPSDYQRLRANTGDNTESLTDPAAEAIFEQAAEMYGPEAVYAGARVLRLLELLGGAYKLTSYRQNASAEELSDVFKHLLKGLEIWEGKASAAAHGASGAAARFGGTRRKPARIKEYPTS